MEQAGGGGQSVRTIDGLQAKRKQGGGTPPALRNRRISDRSYQSRVALNLNRRPFMIPATLGNEPGSV